MRSVEHVYATRPGTIVEIVAEALAIEISVVQGLLEIGAIWSARVPPLPPPQKREFLDAEHIATIEAARARASAAGLPKKFFQQKPERARVDVAVCEGSYIRVHTQVKRFPVAHEVDWASRVISITPHFVVVDKVAGVQCTPSEDNVTECLPACIQKALGLCEELIPTHRLDEGTEGVVLIARTPAFASYFQTTLKRAGHTPGLVRKFYRCLTRAPPPLGFLHHRVRVGHRFCGSPKFTAVLAPTDPARGSDQDEGTSLHSRSLWPSHMCALEVLEVNQLESCDVDESLRGSELYESIILLHTGRTHQIRAQLGAMGCPLIGDTLYQTLHGLGALQVPQDFQHRPKESSFEISRATPLLDEVIANSPSDKIPFPNAARVTPSEDVVLDQTDAKTARIDWPGLLGEVGRMRIALQAFKLEVHDESNLLETCPSVFQAGPPWWRIESSGKAASK